MVFVRNQQRPKYVCILYQWSFFVLCCDCNSDSVLQIGFALQVENKVKGSRTPSWLYKIILCKFICMMVYSSATKAVQFTLSEPKDQTLQSEKANSINQNLMATNVH